MSSLEAITVWGDESEVIINNKKHVLIGLLITDSDINEHKLSIDLIESRKKNSSWHTIHGCELGSEENPNNKRSYDLIREWVNLFKGNKKTYFHVFCYPENKSFASNGHQRYFAKQSVFGLALKMKKTGATITTFFKDVRTLRVLFDKRDDRIGSETSFDFSEEIKKQINKQSGRDNITTRFSFVSSECFNVIQLSDILLYFVKLRIEKEQGIEMSERQLNILKIWEDSFLNENIKSIKDFNYDTKFNFFLSRPQ